MTGARRLVSAWVVSLATAVLCLAPVASGAAEKRPITERDLLAFVWIADPRMSPDGQRVAFVKVTVNEKGDGYDTALWLVDTAGNAPERRLTAGPRDVAPRWSPDGSRLAFLRAVSDKTPPRPQAYVIDMSGGEAYAVTGLAQGAGDPVWSPDGSHLAFTSTTKPEEPEAQSSLSDVRVVTKATYRADNSGYRDPSRKSAVWVVPVPVGGPAGPPRRLTDGQFDEGSLSWSPDSARVLFTSRRAEEPYYDPPDADVFSVGLTGGAPTRVASIDGALGRAVVSPDGTHIAFSGIENGKPTRSYDQPDLFVGDLGGAGDVRNLTARYDFDIASGVTGDQHAPRGGRAADPVWTPDGKGVIVSALERGRANLLRVDIATGATSPVTSGDHEVVSFSASRDGSRMALLVSTPTAIGDLFVFDTRDRAMRQLTRVNDALVSTLHLTPPEELWVTSFDGRKVQVLVQRPPDFDPGRKYPLILNIHGGPHAAYGFTFFHEMQWMAARGYVVVYPNPRGSTSFGQEFGNIIQYRYPGDDGHDLMAAVDAVIKQGSIDEGRLGVTGGSGGGVLTNYLVTKTDRFKAAVSQRSIADWAAWWYTADFTMFQPRWFRGAPFEQTQDFAERSAITHVARIRTPMMFIEGEVDFRTPPTAGGEQLFRALKYLKRPTVMVQFPGESHELSRSGQPRHRVERLKHIINWFDKYLLDKPVDVYDR